MRDALESLRADLVGRRLWPLIVVLVAALVAVPLLLGRQGASATPEPAPSTAEASRGDGALTAARSALHAPAAPASRSSRRDPFARPRPRANADAGSGADGSPAASIGASSVTGGSAPGSGSSTSSGGSGSATGSTSTGGAGSTTGSTSTGDAGSTSRSTSTDVSGSTRPSRPAAARAAQPTDRARATKPVIHVLRHPDIRFGARDHEDVARLTALPSPGAPVVQFLGVTATGRAAFAVAPGTLVEGDAACRPSRLACTQILLARGQRAFLTSDGRRTSLKLLRIRTTKTRSEERARRFYARVSKAGRCLRDLTDSFDFDTRTGMLNTPKRPKAAAACRYTKWPTGAVTLR